MTDQEQQQTRRRSRERRKARVAGQSAPSGFFASPLSAVICMFVALGSILAYWRGVPSWALLALGIGALLVMTLGVALWRARQRRPD